MPRSKTLLLQIAFLVNCGSFLCGQTPAHLPRQRASFGFADGKGVSVEYGPLSAPRQKIFGAVVPYGKIWGAGGGQATSLATNVFLQIDNVVVPPGTYSIYLLPSAGDWLLILNQKIGQSADTYPAGYDFARIKTKKRLLGQPVDPFTILFKTHGPGAGAIKFRWGDTEVWVNFQEQLGPSEAGNDAS
jgi:hypothetical protein